MIKNVIVMSWRLAGGIWTDQKSHVKVRESKGERITRQDL